MEPDRPSTTASNDVEEVERESFPASDAPGWTLGEDDDRDHGGPGAVLADFALPASTGQTLGKRAFLDKVPMIVVFVPGLSGDETAMRLGAYNERLKEFGSLPSQVLAVAKATASEVRAAADEMGIRFPILADPTGDFAADCDAVDDTRSFRHVTLVTDTRGQIRHRLEDVAADDEAEAAHTFVDELVAT